MNSTSPRNTGIAAAATFRPAPALRPYAASGASASTVTRHGFAPSALVLACAVALLSLGADAALAQAAPTGAETGVAVELSLPAQPLAQTLATLSRRFGTAIGGEASLLDGRQAPALSGSLTLAQALTRALHGSALGYVRNGAAITIVRRASTPDAPAEAKFETTELSRVTVNGFGAHDGKLVTTRSLTATKTDATILETPQTISVIPAEQLELLKPRDLAEAMTYTAGVTRAAYVDRVADQFVVRGFGSTNLPYVDGMRYQVGIYDGQIEPYGLQSIEVLKGAASTLYGSQPPGGLINATSKQPTVEPVREVGLDIGSFQRRQLQADFGGALTEDEQWSYRLTAVKRDSDTSLDYGRDDRTYIAGAVRWQPGPRTSLTLRAEYQKDDTVYNPGYPLYGTALASPYGEVPESRFIGEPGFDKYAGERKVLGYRFEHQFNDQLTLRHGLRHYDGQDHRREAQARNYYGFTETQRTFTRRGHERYQSSEGWTTDTSLLIKAETAGVKHEALVGLDYARTTWHDQYYIYTMTDQDLFNPVYGGGVLSGPTRLDDSWTDRGLRQIGLYAQDQLKFGERWVVLAGGRQDWVRNDDRNPLDGSVLVDNERSHKFTGRLGAVYLADHGLAPFAGWSQSFQPQTGSDRTGNRFKPTAGEQYEMGVRWQPSGTDTMVSASVYQLTQDNVTVTDPENTAYSVQQGQVRSRGFELEARTRVGRNANLIAAYAYTDARTTKSSPLTPAKEGMRVAYSPYHQLSVWGDYAMAALGLPGLRLGLGLRYTGDTREDGSAMVVPDYTLLDAMVSYSTGPWRLSLNVKNLADKRHITACSFHTCFLGEPRSVIGSVNYRW